MKREFTASVYIIHEHKVLLIAHKKLNKWLSPGGHIEENETPGEAAKREVKEETGLDIEFIQQENIWINCWNAKSIERPFMCLLEEIPAYRDVPAHQHIDMIYVGKPCGGELYDTNDLRWFTFEEIQMMTPDKEIFKETQQVISHLLSQDLILQSVSNEV